MAIGMWLVASLVFSFYLSRFPGYNKIYGSAGTVVILLIWFWVSTFAILVGAEINAALEGRRHTNDSDRQIPGVDEPDTTRAATSDRA